MTRKRWSDNLVGEALLPLVESFGRMPSRNELAAAGHQALAVQVAKRGGFRFWARRLGAEMKDSETFVGRSWEEREAEFFRGLDMTVQRMTARAPFDMLVDWRRVDVKSATWSEYRRGSVSGFVFAGFKRGRDADWFDLVCHDGTDVLHRFLIPRSAVNVETVTISPLVLSGGGKWSPYAGALSLLNHWQGLAA